MNQLPRKFSLQWLIFIFGLSSTRYRDLVGTAETIVAMNRDIQDVETVLADVGRRCNPRLVERKHAHARQIKSGDAEKGRTL